ncbi:MAG: hypothetical protein EOM12_09045, partial [Verrucomicrobiae bacterium]|nr:hypothetical protein [Verrucomicrobiae bacterium]
ASFSGASFSGASFSGASFKLILMACMIDPMINGLVLKLISLIPSHSDSLSPIASPFASSLFS